MKSTNLKEHATAIINCEKKEMLPLTNKEQKSYKKQNFCHKCIQKLNKEFNENKNYFKVQDHCRYTEKYSE